MKIEIPDDQLTDVFSAAVLQTLSPETQKMLIQASIEHLIKVPENDNRGYGRNLQQPSPLQRAFNNALENFTRTAVKDILEADTELTGKIKDLVQEVAKVQYDAREAFQTRVVEALIEQINDMKVDN